MKTRSKFQNILTPPPDFMPEHLLYRIGDKECQGNYVLISKGQHWRSPAEKLEKEMKTRLQSCQEKTRGKVKLKLIWINQAYA